MHGSNKIKDLLRKAVLSPIAPYGYQVLWRVGKTSKMTHFANVEVKLGTGCDFRFLFNVWISRSVFDKDKYQLLVNNNLVLFPRRRRLPFLFDCFEELITYNGHNTCGVERSRGQHLRITHVECLISF